MQNHRILTAESVTEGHPDKLSDLIADKVLDECLKKDKNARVACEVMATAGKVIVAGEITAEELPDILAIACETISGVGYSGDYEVEANTHDQSGDLKEAVEGTHCSESALPLLPVGLGAGDQGIVYGYATDETEEMLPLPCVLAHRITLSLTMARKFGLIKGLLPDGKAQVSVEYDGKTPVRLAAVVVSCQHEADKDVFALRREILRRVLGPALSGFKPDKDTVVLINPSGRFVEGGFEADTGLTGRKLMVDTYGGFVPHGGGALSGKDGTKVDRSGAYMARYAAKNVVAAGLARECTVSVAYAVGRALPLAVTVDTHETGMYDDEIISQAIREVFSFRPSEMICELKLDTPIFAQSCCYGHFMKEHLPWEQTDKSMELRKACGRA